MVAHSSTSGHQHRSTASPVLAAAEGVSCGSDGCVPHLAYARRMEIVWLQAVIDLPSERFEVAADFWTAVSATRRGDVHPDHPEFMHLVPAKGDMTLELQRIDDGSPSVHLDLVVRDIPAWTRRATACGADLLAEPGHAVLTTPGGVPFCIVPAGGESLLPAPIDPAVPHAVDQICLDVPHGSFDAEVAFWSDFTGWPANPPSLPEFRSFAQPEHLPLRLLVQRLGDDDPGPPRAHLDISSAGHVDVVVTRHVDLGATVSGRFEHWTALTDPAGLPYCVTARLPASTGST